MNLLMCKQLPDTFFLFCGAYVPVLEVCLCWWLSLDQQFDGYSNITNSKCKPETLCQSKSSRGINAVFLRPFFAARLLRLPFVAIVTAVFLCFG